jgi:hypothetical protein
MPRYRKTIPQDLANQRFLNKHPEMDEYNRKLNEENNKKYAKPVSYQRPTGRTGNRAV